MCDCCVRPFKKLSDTFDLLLIRVKEVEKKIENVFPQDLNKFKSEILENFHIASDKIKIDTEKEIYKLEINCKQFAEHIKSDIENKIKMLDTK